MTKFQKTMSSSLIKKLGIAHEVHITLNSFLHSYAVQKEGSEGDTKDDQQVLDSARSSFSLAIKGVACIFV